MLMSTDTSQSFDSLAVLFDRFRVLQARLYGASALSRVAECVRAGRVRRAIDLGCGTGQLTRFLADHVPEVIGVDLAEPMIEYARRQRHHPHVTYFVRDLCEVTPDRDGHFDFVVSYHTLHHVPDLESALRGIRALLAPGGQVLLVDSVHVRGGVSRWQVWTQAVGALLRGALRGRPRTAWRFFRVVLHPAWVAHRLSDVFCTPAEFDARYLSVFPGATITDAPSGSRALHWRAPM
jgi:SAM-dependent methyltransferase